MLGVARAPGAPAGSAQQLLALLYDDLRRIASRMMARERVGHTLQPTALVNEACLRIVESGGVTACDRTHVFRLAANVMRHVLVDHARRWSARKRGGNRVRVPLEGAHLRAPDVDTDVLDLHRSLERLEALDARTAAVAELRLFGGCTVEQVAAALGVSVATVDNEWRFACAWLGRALSEAA